MGLIGEIADELVYRGKKELKRAIIEGLRDALGQGHRDDYSYSEWQPTVDTRQNIWDDDDSYISSGQSNYHRYKRENSSHLEEGRHIMAEDITENSEITQYQDASKALCINANNKVRNNKNPLEKDKDNLLKKYPGFGMKDAAPADFFDEIIERVFIDGIPRDVFIRNYTFSDSNTKNPKLAIRYKRMPNDYLSNILPANKTLLFKGYVSGNYFVVDGVSEQYDEELLAYEVSCSIIRYEDEARVKSSGGNFLYGLAEEAAALNEHTKARLEEWKDYIKWRRVIVKKRMHGARYVKVENKEGNLAFTLEFADKDSYIAEAKWLKRGELAAYDGKEYCGEDGNFEYNEKNHSRNEKFEPVGNQIRRLSKEGREVNGHYEIELVYDIPDNDDNVEEMTDEERNDYVQNQLLPNYSSTGFLAPLVIKDLSLFNRLDKAIVALQQDRDCRSPNMAMWIFDVTRARLPQPQDRREWEERVGVKWLNTSLANNPNQREAIFKMLETPDLCLIQGPPGTGKTTVIAEAIYQLARQGNRVLLASQSHDAVDNALDRLADCPEIRAIRLGERERNRDEAGSKFGESKVLSTYYGTLSQSVRSKFLLPWDKNRHDYKECELELRDWRNVVVDLDKLNQDCTQQYKKLEDCSRKLKEAEKNQQKASKENEEQENAKRQYINFKGIAERNELSNGEFYIPDAMRDVAASIFGRLIRAAAERNIMLAPSVTENVIGRKPELSIRRIAVSADKLFTLRDRLSEASKNANTDANIVKLQMQDIDDKIRTLTDQLAEEDDQERRKELKDKRKCLREEKEQLRKKGAFMLSADELSLLDEELRAKVQSPEGQAQMVKFISTIESEYQATVREFVKRMGEAVAAYKPHDIQALSEQVKSYKGKIKQRQEELNSKENEITVKKKLGETLSKKYSCETSEIESRLKAELDRLAAEWDKEDPIRKVWRGTLEKFTEVLNDSQTAKYDKGYYEDIYISSCNVVGITCTAKMRDLDDKFPDFDVVIIDEVSKATPPELLPTLMRARKTILVGDHRQLPPVFNEYEKSYNELLEEISTEADSDDDDNGSEMVLRKDDLNKYRMMVTSSLFREYFEKADERIKHSLLTQYRMHSDIQKVINRFYDGKLKSGVEEVEKETKAHGLEVMTDRGESFLRPDSHAYWVDSSKLHGKLMEQSRYPGSTSLHNIFERYIILSMLSKINAAYAAMGQSDITVGVISFYGSQVSDIRKAVKELRKRGQLKALKVDVNTVDRFQGKEKQIIITSLVCNTRHGNASRHVAAFERINVAFSRAQNLLIIVGAQDLYSGLTVSIPNMDTGEMRSARIYQGIIDDIARNGARIAGDTLIAPEEVVKIREEYDKEAKER